MKLLILQTDHVLESFQAEHGTYPQMFLALLEQAGLDQERMAVATLDATDVAAAYPDPTGYDGYLITGSKHSVYDDLPWIPKLADFVGTALAAQRRVVGICFGHQLLAHFFGGEVGPASQGWAVGLVENEFFHEEPWMRPMHARLALISSHRDQVLKLPPNSHVVARTERCAYAAFVMGEHALAVQSHPEFSAEYAKDLISSRRQLLGDSICTEGVQSLSQPLDNAVAGRWIANFLTDSCIG